MRGRHVIGLLLLTACSRRADDAAVVRAGGLEIRTALSPAVSRVGDNLLDVELRDAEGRPVQGAAVDVEVVMHAMGAMPQMGGPAHVAELGGGKYQAHFGRLIILAPMQILVSNDDGILAPGLALLAEVCQTVGQVIVVAPDREQSGTSHSLTMHRPLRPARRPDGAYQIDGTPTDCVLLAVGALMKERPSFIFSGVNQGPNMGEDVLYSGTVAAAMEGVALGVPGIAVSFAGPMDDLETMASYRDVLKRLVERIVRVEFPPETLLNINLPPCGATSK